ncbi:MAG: DUF389 domain-containing protein [Pirellulaceae bacterium]
MASHAELCLLITAEAEIASGLALAERLATRNGYDTDILVVTDSKSSGLVDQITARIASLPNASSFSVELFGTDIEALLKKLNHDKSLRLLLVPGLDQMNDNRKMLLRQIHATVVVFEPHAGLMGVPTKLRLVGEDIGAIAAWLSNQLASTPELTSTTMETLQASTKLAKVTDEADTASDWVLLACGADTTDAAARTAKVAIEVAAGPVILVRPGDSWLQWLTLRYLPTLATRFVPQMSREARRTLAEDLSNYSKLDFDFIALICAATFLASFGLVQDSAAVIIGAMLVAPLMTPILGAGLSLTQGNKPLFAGSLRTIAIGFLAALLTSFLFGLLIRMLPTPILPSTADGRILLTGEMWSRTSPSVIDFLVGLVGGSAAAYARTRHHLSAALAGAAIAAALVPPIATAGIQLSMLFQEIAPPEHRTVVRNLIYGPMLLFLANMLTIMIGSSFVLWSCGVRGTHHHSRKDRWTTRMTVLLLLLTVAVAVWIVQHPA